MARPGVPLGVEHQRPLVMPADAFAWNGLKHWRRVHQRQVAQHEAYQQEAPKPTANQPCVLCFHRFFRLCCQGCAGVDDAGRKAKYTAARMKRNATA
jgi:hypothetical protein